MKKIFLLIVLTALAWGSYTFSTSTNVNQLYCAADGCTAVVPGGENVHLQPGNDWVRYTPTGSWVSNTDYYGRWRQNGPNMDVEVRVVTSGAPTATILTVNLPTGYEIDDTKLLYSGNQRVGAGLIEDPGNDDYPAFILRAPSNVLRVSFIAGDGSIDPVTQAAPMTWASGDFVIVTFSVPIKGW